jgi:hypothetical protein
MKVVLGLFGDTEQTVPDQMHTIAGTAAQCAAETIRLREGFAHMEIAYTARPGEAHEYETAIAAPVCVRQHR